LSFRVSYEYVSNPAMDEFGRVGGAPTASSSGGLLSGASLVDLSSQGTVSWPEKGGSGVGSSVGYEADNLVGV
jgi:hypothetical protein